MSQLALFGGEKTIQKPFRRFNTYGKEEITAATQVLERGVLSEFLGSWHPDYFYGGPQVKAFETEWAETFQAKHAVSVNSATSGLIAAIGAMGIEPGDEVILSPWTMCATATSILMWNAIPVFSDIELETFNLDPTQLKAQLSDRTKGIVVTNMFGHPARLSEIKQFADAHGLWLIEDNAQSPLAREGEALAGTVGAIGIFSLNYHKHIHTGEGGVCVTKDPALAERLQLIRNHAEAVVDGKGVTDLTNMIGYNFRLGELESAIGRAQLKKLPEVIERRQRTSGQLAQELQKFPGLQPPAIRENCTHVYYDFPILFSERELSKGKPIHRNRLMEALQAEGLPKLSRGCLNIHLLPLFQKKQAYGTKGFPWRSEVTSREVSYDKGICPNAEYAFDEAVFGFPIHSIDLEESDIPKIAQAFEKVWNNLDALG